VKLLYFYKSIIIKSEALKKLIISLILLFPVLLFAQEETKTSSCKVLLTSINENYDGDCKKGLAHGSGKAEGIDTYTGEFKKGLPNGNGIYTWKSGDVYEGNWKNGERSGFGTLTVMLASSDSIIEGYWKLDKYIGKEKRVIKYKVITKTNVDRVEFIETPETGNKVRIEFLRMGSKLPVEQFFISGSSGRESTRFVGFEDYEVPFRCRLTYETSNKMNSQMVNCSVEFEILIEGSYSIRVYN